jgi:hypothetical protein
MNDTVSNLLGLIFDQNGKIPKNPRLHKQEGWNYKGFGLANLGVLLPYVGVWYIKIWKYRVAKFLKGCSLLR